MKYNTGAKYNFPETEGGGAYNGATIGIMVKLFDVASFYEDKMQLIAKSILTDRLSLSDFLFSYILFEHKEFVQAKDKSWFHVLIDILEKEKIPDVLSPIVVSLLLSERTDILEELRNLGTLVEHYESIYGEDEITLDALIEAAEKEGLKDVAKLLTLIARYDFGQMIDRNPRKAISDFLIGHVDNKDNAYDWIFPFEMKIDWRNSNVQVMPQTESTYIDMPGKDGSLIENTVYKNRLFTFVAFSELGLSIAQKEEMKRDIAQILDSTKNNPKKFVFQNSGTAFDAVYSGAASITEGPSFVKATLPFEVPPYGYKLFDQSVYGTGLIVNDGDTDAGCVHVISSGAVNPSFELGSITYRWKGTVPQDSKLVIDHNDYTCYLESVTGTRSNAIDRLEGEFQLVPKHTSIAITAFGNTKNYLTTSIKENILWKGV